MWRGGPHLQSRCCLTLIFLPLRCHVIFHTCSLTLQYNFGRWEDVRSVWYGCLLPLFERRQHPDPEPVRVSPFLSGGDSPWVCQLSACLPLRPSFVGSPRLPSSAFPISGPLLGRGLRLLYSSNTDATFNHARKTKQHIAYYS